MIRFIVSIVKFTMVAWMNGYRPVKVTTIEGKGANGDIAVSSTVIWLKPAPRLSTFVEA